MHQQGLLKLHKQQFYNINKYLRVDIFHTINNPWCLDQHFFPIHLLVQQFIFILLFIVIMQLFKSIQIESSLLFSMILYIQCSFFYFHPAIFKVFNCLIQEQLDMSLKPISKLSSNNSKHLIHFLLISMANNHHTQFIQYPWVLTQ